MSETTEYSGAVVPAQRGIRITSMADAMEFGRMICAAGLAPKPARADDPPTTPETVAAICMCGAELGFGPMQSLGTIAKTRGKLGIYGDAAMALVRASGLLSAYSQTYAGDGVTRSCTVFAEREGRDKLEQSFSASDAKRAGLWGSAGPWTTSPDRMLMFRARGFLLRDLFADVLRGLVTVEELRDMPKDEPAKKEAPRCDLLASPAARVVEAETVETLEAKTPSEIIGEAWGVYPSSVGVWLESKGKSITVEQARRVAASEKHKAEFIAWDAAVEAAQSGTTAEGGAV